MVSGWLYVYHSQNCYLKDPNSIVCCMNHVIHNDLAITVVIVAIVLVNQAISPGLKQKFSEDLQ